MKDRVSVPVCTRASARPCDALFCTCIHSNAGIFPTTFALSNVCLCLRVLVDIRACAGLGGGGGGGGERERETLSPSSSALKIGFEDAKGARVDNLGK